MTLTLQDLQRFLGAPDEAADVQTYVDAASVLAAFDPVTLRPLGGDAKLSDVRFEPLLALCEPITDGAYRGRWSLSLASRRVALRRLGTRARMTEALAANPKRIQTPVQRAFERVIGGEPIALGKLARDELAALITVGEWVRGLLPDVPDDALVRRVLARHDLVAPLLRLTAGGFVNRAQELTQLAEFVSNPSPQSPLFVHGPGGVGKSTLLARFLLDQIERDDRAFAYIDIDRPTIDPERPNTLLAEALAQLGMQLELPPRAGGFAERMAESLGREEGMRQFESFGELDSDWITQFAELLAEAPGDRTSIIIVDTFEEAQFLGADVVWPLTDFLVQLMHVPQVRLVVSGRTLPEASPLAEHPIDLGVLDLESARGLLTTAIADARLPKLTPDELDDVISVVSRNPMCLKLAVRLLRDEGVGKLRSMRSEVLARLKSEKVQALLYGRILHHIHAEDVKRIAYPGLIVRRITPEVIREVLAEPCKLKLMPDRDEYAIFWDLDREAALVDRDPEDGSLRHRADVRRAMLEDLTDHVEQKVVAEIDAAAITFYEQQNGPIARAEEIYHRLRRCDPPATLDQRWMPEAGGRLKGAGEELHAQQRLWLAEKLGATLDPRVRETASQEAWEAQSARSVDRFLLSGLAEQALEVLHEREERLPRSELFSLEAEACRFLGRHDEALRVARGGVESTTKAGAIDMALELLLKMVLIEEGRGGYAAASALAQEAAAVASHSTNDMLEMRTVVTELRVHRMRYPDLHDARAGMRAKALAMLTPEVIHALRSQSVLLREVAAELAKEDARVAAAAFETLGVEVVTDEQAEKLGRALSQLHRAAPGKDALSPELTQAVEAFEDSDFDPEIVKEWSMERTTRKDTRDIGRAIARAEPGAEVLKKFRDYFRAGVAHSIRGPSGSR